MRIVSLVTGRVENGGTQLRAGHIWRDAHLVPALRIGARHEDAAVAAVSPLQLALVKCVRRLREQDGGRVVALVAVLRLLTTILAAELYWLGRILTGLVDPDVQALLPERVNLERLPELSAMALDGECIFAAPRRLGQHLVNVDLRVLRRHVVVRERVARGAPDDFGRPLARLLLLYCLLHVSQESLVVDHSARRVEELLI